MVKFDYSIIGQLKGFFSERLPLGGYALLLGSPNEKLVKEIVDITVDFGLSPSYDSKTLVKYCKEKSGEVVGVLKLSPLSNPAYVEDDVIGYYLAKLTKREGLTVRVNNKLKNICMWSTDQDRHNERLCCYTGFDVKIDGSLQRVPLQELLGET
jgi:hypothetical protein